MQNSLFFILAKVLKQEEALSEMIELYPTLGQAYRLRELFNDLWSMPDKVSAEAFQALTISR